jgi:hypothetical protein
MAISTDTQMALLVNPHHLDFDAPGTLHRWLEMAAAEIQVRRNLQRTQIKLMCETRKRKRLTEDRQAFSKAHVIAHGRSEICEDNPGGK